MLLIKTLKAILIEFINNLFFITNFIEVSCFPHHYVQIEYFENLIRYSRFFEVYPEYLDEALLSLIDQRFVFVFVFVFLETFLQNILLRQKINKIK